MSMWSRIKEKRQAPPEIQICSPLSPLECHKKLTGKDKPRWLGNPFLKMLSLHGTMSDSHDCGAPAVVFCFMAPSTPTSPARASLCGQVNPWRMELGSETKRSPQQSRRFRSSATTSGRVVSRSVFCSFRASIWSCVGTRNTRLTWPEYPANPDELAQMLAGHLQGVVFESKGSWPTEPFSAACWCAS